MMSQRQPADSYLFKQDSIDYRIGKLKKSIYRRLTRGAMPLFFRGGDTISSHPLVNGEYEPEIKALIEHYADAGHADFFIDVGANIGLTSCQSGRRFKEVHLYEPNQDCCHILRVNTNIMLSGHHYHIHEYGLGEKADTLRFCIPNNNWGGAFVVSDANAYSVKTQASKDGHKEFDPSNYRISDVRIEPAETVMRSLFEDLSRRSLNAGVIKIDVEGYELVVLEAIAKTIPANMSVMVIFENWSEEISFSTVLHDLGMRGKLMNLVTIKHPFKLLPRWVNTLLLLVRGNIDTILAPNDAKAHIGGLVLEISAHSETAALC